MLAIDKLAFLQGYMSKQGQDDDLPESQTLLDWAKQRQKRKKKVPGKKPRNTQKPTDAKFPIGHGRDIPGPAIGHGVSVKRMSNTKG